METNNKNEKICLRIAKLVMVMLICILVLEVCSLAFFVSKTNRARKEIETSGVSQKKDVSEKSTEEYLDTINYYRNICDTISIDGSEEFDIGSCLPMHHQNENDIISASSVLNYKFADIDYNYLISDFAVGYVFDIEDEENDEYKISVLSDYDEILNYLERCKSDYTDGEILFNEDSEMIESFIFYNHNDELYKPTSCHFKSIDDIPDIGYHVDNMFLGTAYSGVRIDPKHITSADFVNNTINILQDDGSVSQDVADPWLDTYINCTYYDENGKIQHYYQKVSEREFFEVLNNISEFEKEYNVYVPSNGFYALYLHKDNDDLKEFREKYDTLGFVSVLELCFEPNE